MKKKLKKIILNPKLAVGIAVIIALVIGGISYVNHKNNLEKTFAKIDELSQNTLGYSSISEENLTLAFPVGGKVQTVDVKIGDKVVAGQVLATLDQSNALAALQSAQGALAQAKANYNKILAAATPQDVAVSSAAVEVASTALQNAKQNLLNEFRTAVSNTKTAVLSSTNNLFSNPQSTNPQFGIAGTVQTNQELVSEVNNERVKINANLIAWKNEVDGVNADNVDKVSDDSLQYLSSASDYFADIISLLTTYSQSNSSTGNATLSTNQTAVANAKASVDGLYTAIVNYNQAVKSAGSSLDSAKAQLSLKQSPARNEDVAVANAQVISAQGQVDLANANLNNTVLKAPISGTVTQVDVKVGEQAQAMKEVIILHN